MDKDSCCMMLFIAAQRSSRQISRFAIHPASTYLKQKIATTLYISQIIVPSNFDIEIDLLKYISTSDILFSKFQILNIATLKQSTEQRTKANYKLPSRSPRLHEASIVPNTSAKMASNPLSPDSILKHMAEALPTHAKDDTNSDISSSYEAIALFSHACMIAVGFRLLGYGEGQKNGELYLSMPQRGRYANN
jgi:hypothetical protein